MFYFQVYLSGYWNIILELTYFVKSLKSFDMFNFVELYLNFFSIILDKILTFCITHVFNSQAYLSGQAMKLSGVNIQHVYSSPSLRSVQTAHSILTGIFYSFLKYLQTYLVILLRRFLTVYTIDWKTLKKLLLLIVHFHISVLFDIYILRNVYKFIVWFIWVYFDRLHCLYKK